MSQQGRLIDQNLESLTGDTGGPVFPDASETINIVGGDTTVVDGNPGTSTLTINASTGGYPVTPYVVGPSGSAGYQTIQAALTAIGAGNAGQIWVQPGTYTEDLVFPDGIDVGIITGSDEDAGAAEIVGVHTPPDTGNVVLWRMKMTSSTHIFSSNAAGTAALVCSHNNYSTDGYIFNCPNWTGSFTTFAIGDFLSTSDGIINNTGGATAVLFQSGLGVGTTNPCIISGTCLIQLMDISTPITIQGSAACEIEYSSFFEDITFDGSSSGYVTSCRVASGSDAAITYSTSGNFSFSNLSLNSSNDPCLDGAGAGTLNLNGINFEDNSNIAGTLTLASGTTYSGTYKSDYTDGGVLLGQGAVEDIVATTAGADGQLLIGATSADPAFASLTSSGGTITITEGANTLNVEAGATIPTSFVTDAGTAIPAANILNVLGTAAQGLTSSGAGSTVTLTISDAAEAQKGVVEIATTAETIAYALDTVVITPSKLADGFASPTEIGGTTPNIGNFTFITAVGSGAGAQNVIDITPGTAIGGVAWHGIDIDGSALDPTTTGATITGMDIDLSGVSLANDPIMDGLLIQLPATFSGAEEKHCIRLEGFGSTIKICDGDDGTAISADGEIHVDFNASGLAAGQIVTVFDGVVELGTATDGHVHALDISTGGSGSVEVIAVSTHPGVDVIHQHIGTAGAIDQGWIELGAGGFTDSTAAFNGAPDLPIFVNNTDLIYIGMTGSFDHLVISLDTFASKDLRPIFEYSTGAGFSAFLPSDDTNGFQQDGSIFWNASSLAGFAARVVNGSANLFFIRITRDRAGALTNPIEDTIQTLSATEFEWNKEGDISVRNLAATTLTDHAAMVADGNGQLTSLAAATNGQLLIGSTGADLAVAALASADSTVTITNGAGTIDLSVPSGGIVGWTEVTGAAQAGVVNQGYITNRGAGVTVTLPDTAAVGSVLRIAGKLGNWVLAQNAGETVHFGDQDTTPGAGGSLTATDASDCIELVCTTANTDWTIVSSIGGDITVT